MANNTGNVREFCQSGKVGTLNITCLTFCITAEQRNKQKQPVEQTQEQIKQNYKKMPFPNPTQYRFLNFAESSSRLLPFI